MQIQLLLFFLYRKQASQQSQQRSIHILDDESNRYYQETVPAVPAAPINRIDVKNENSYRNLEVRNLLKKN